MASRLWPNSSGSVTLRTFNRGMNQLRPAQPAEVLMDTGLTAMQTTKVALIGMGTVGTGVARLLIDHGDRTARHAGRTLWVESVVVSDIKKPRDYELPKGVLTDDLSRVLKNPDIKLAVVLVGGIEPARTITLQLLESGKDIV